MNKNEAERELAKVKREYELNLGYCPLIQNTCRKDCMAYFEGSIQKFPHHHEGDWWKIISPRCESPIVTGVIVVET